MTEDAHLLREPIAQSWHRATLAGLAPDTAGTDLPYDDVDPRSHLLAAARPVLEDLDTRLSETGMSTLLVDRGGRVVHRWCGDRTAQAMFDGMGVGVGASLSEDALGTNAPGTALETRRSIVIHGAEHFAERLRRFSCYGHPIFHPTTRRIEGVLDISVLAEQASPLLAPLIARAVADIEQHLLEGSRGSERALLSAFQSASRRRRPIVAVGEDLLVSNQAASDLLDTTDLVLLRNFAGELATHASATATLVLELRAGPAVTVTAERVPGGRGGVLMHLRPASPSTAVGAVGPVGAGRVTSADERAGHLHVAGQPGSGRTTAAHERAPSRPVATLSGGQAILGGSAAWAEQFAAVVRAGRGTVCIDDVDLLPPELVQIVARHAETRRPPHLVLTSGPADVVPGTVRALTALCTDTVELLPLAHRTAELPVIAQAMLTALGHDGHHLTPGALRALGAYHWPGNLSELRAVLDQVAQRRGAGAIVVGDLPSYLGGQGPTRDLASLERAERDAVIAALQACGGNKVQAAQRLGISRTTLYAKMRSLQVQTY